LSGGKAMANHTTTHNGNQLKRDRLETKGAEGGEIKKIAYFRNYREQTRVRQLSPKKNEHHRHPDAPFYMHRSTSKRKHRQTRTA
jgi:hypothetical protein